MYYSDSELSLMNRSISEWLQEYRLVVQSYNIGEKTQRNRVTLINWIESQIGNKPVGFIKPYEIAAVIKPITLQSPSKAKRLLIEIKNMFTEAVIYGWTDKNPAAYLKHVPYKVQRERLSLEDWRKLFKASKNSPKWVSRLLLLALVTGQRRSDLQKIQFSDVWDNKLHITQQKTGTKLAIPLQLKLDAIGVSVEDTINSCRYYCNKGNTLIRKTTGQPPCPTYLSIVFETLVRQELPGKNTSLHECRSLSERLYREQGINTRLLLGHKHQAMTDLYNDDRGLDGGKYIDVPLNR